MPGNSVFIIGCGISAQLMIMAARAFGAGRIIAMDNIPFRLEMARRNGADDVIDSEDDIPPRLREVNNGRLADRVIICRPLVQVALDCVDKGGTVLFFAGAEDPKETIPVPWNDIFWRSEVTLTSSYAGPPSDSERALALIAAERVPVNSMITHRLPLSGLGQGIEMLTHPWEHEAMKIIIEPQR
jgi:L-iditol 2-dehydrogenase